mmetsp:Transcript_26378/g.73751  ORF Transcript_26378/g.73751 Transcript_26378/m.73751 type:complete len:375 (-) Transcript_26378:502-1626(-)
MYASMHIYVHTRTMLSSCTCTCTRSTLQHEDVADVLSGMLGQIFPTPAGLFGDVVEQRLVHAERPVFVAEEDVTKSVPHADVNVVVRLLGVHGIGIDIRRTGETDQDLIKIDGTTNAVGVVQFLRPVAAIHANEFSRLSFQQWRILVQDVAHQPEPFEERVFRRINVKFGKDATRNDLSGRIFDYGLVLIMSQRCGKHVSHGLRHAIVRLSGWRHEVGRRSTPIGYSPATFALLSTLATHGGRPAHVLRLLFVDACHDVHCGIDDFSAQLPRQSVDDTKFQQRARQFAQLEFFGVACVASCFDLFLFFFRGYALAVADHDGVAECNLGEGCDPCNLGKHDRAAKTRVENAYKRFQRCQYCDSSAFAHVSVHARG